MIKTLLIKGYRGFGSNDTELNFSIPNGTIHSGLNNCGNNSGKSTITSRNILLIEEKNILGSKKSIK